MQTPCVTEPSWICRCAVRRPARLLVASDVEEVRDPLVELPGVGHVDRDHRDPGLDRLAKRLVDGVLVEDRAEDAVRLRRDRLVEQVDVPRDRELLERQVRDLDAVLRCAVADAVPVDRPEDVPRLSVGDGVERQVRLAPARRGLGRGVGGLAVVVVAACRRPRAAAQSTGRLRRSRPGEQGAPRDCALQRCLDRVQVVKRPVVLAHSLPFVVVAPVQIAAAVSAISTRLPSRADVLIASHRTAAR